MRLELTTQQWEYLQSLQTAEAIEIVDPVSNRAYVLIAREQYDQVRPMLSAVHQGAGPLGAVATDIPTGICRSQEALRRDLPGLLSERKLRGQWVCYAGDERIGIASCKAALMRLCLERGLDDDAFYVGRISPDELVLEEELSVPSPSLMVEEGEGIFP